MKVFLHKLTCIDFTSILITTDDATSQYNSFVKELKGTLNSLFPPGSRTPKSKLMIEKRLPYPLGGPKNTRPRLTPDARQRDSGTASQVQRTITLTSALLRHVDASSEEPREGNGRNYATVLTLILRLLKFAGQSF